MATQNGTNVGSVTQPRAIRGKWTTRQRQEIVAASLLAGASVNEVAERYGNACQLDIRLAKQARTGKCSGHQSEEACTIRRGSRQPNGSGRRDDRD